MFRKDYSERLVRLDAVSVGSSIAFVTAPSEAFATTGQFVKENSLFDVTFVMTCGRNTVVQYAPDWPVWFYTELGGETAYEAGNVGRMIPGTAEDMADGLVGLLNNVLYRK